MFAAVSLCAAAGLAGTAVAHTPVTGVSNHHAVEVINQAKRALAGKSSADASLALQRLAILAPRLHGTQKAEANGLLARPTSNVDPQQHKYQAKEQKPLCGAHFCVHWVASTADAPSLDDANANGIPDYVETTLLTSEQVYATENGTLGWKTARSDGKLGGNGKTDIYLAQLGSEGLYGYAAIDPKQGKPGKIPPRSEYAYLVIDQDFSKREFGAPPLLSLEVTLAHEYNHVLQYTYDIFQDGWAGESTATWMEDRVFPDANDYFQYLSPWVRRTAVPLTFFTNAKVYGSAVWNHWLAAKYGPAVVRDAWSGAVKARPGGLSARAYDRSIRRHGKSTFTEDFSRFAADTAEWRVSGVFPEGAVYPDVKRTGSLRSGQSTSRKLNHTAYQLIDVKVPAGGKKLRLNVKAGRTAGAIALVGRIGNGATSQVLVNEKYLRNGGRASVSLPDPSRFARITAVIVNADIHQRGYNGSRRDWIYTRDHVPFRVSVTAGS